MKRPSSTTLALAVLAGAATVLAHFDPWGEDGQGATLVSSRSNARRLLPEIADRSPDGATIELVPANGEPVRIQPGPGGTAELFAGDVSLGPVDPEAVEGLWASLRMATTLRAVPDDAARDFGDTGTIRIGWDDVVLEIWLGSPTSDGAGLYGGRRDPPPDLQGDWVVERELGDLLAQAPRAWLAHRAVVVEPAQLVRVAFDDGLELVRGEDGAWRSRLGPHGEVLDESAVEHRLSRLVSARLDPMFPASDVDVATDGAPWIELHTDEGRSFALWRGGACPGRPERTLIARGPGLRGCLDAALLQPWPAVGRGEQDDGALIDGHLLPPEYGRVLSIAQAHPVTRTLARYGGGWRVEETIAGQAVATDVDEAEVFRWYEAARGAEVALASEPPKGEPPIALDLVLALDSGTRMRLRCTDGKGAPPRCRRDEGPWLAPRKAAFPPLAFDAGSFTDRRLAQLSVDDVRALEILPGPRSDAARQSVHFDLGVWRLDAPLHPAGDDALDEDRLQELLAAASGARVEAWVDAVDDAPLRTLRIDRTPRRGEASTLELELLPGCRARVGKGRPAQLPEGTCASLSTDLLRGDVLAFVLLSAKSVELTIGDAPAIVLVDDEGALRREDGAPLDDIAEVLDELQALELDAVLAGRPSEPPRITLRIRPRSGAAYTVAIGRDFVAFDDAKWWLRTRPATDDDAG